MRNVKNNWKIKDMLAYAEKKYSLVEAYNENGNSNYESYSKKLKRTMKELGMVEKNKTTNRYLYILPEKDAKYLIDVVLRQYFEERTNETILRKKFDKEDEYLNEQALKALENFDPSQDCDTDDLTSDGDIEKSLDRLMLRTLFELFFDFDEESYRNDYKEIELLKNSDDVKEPYQEGYSMLNYRLNHFRQFYCKRKKVFK